MPKFILRRPQEGEDWDVALDRREVGFPEIGIIKLKLGGEIPDGEIASEAAAGVLLQGVPGILTDGNLTNLQKVTAIVDLLTAEERTRPVADEPPTRGGEVSG